MKLIFEARRFDITNLLPWFDQDPSRGRKSIIPSGAWNLSLILQRRVADKALLLQLQRGLQGSQFFVGGAAIRRF
jgi:hypothetical protein